MTYFTSLGVTVSSRLSPGFMELLRSLDVRPDFISRTPSGSVSAVWQDHNHFDESDRDYNAVMDFLDSFEDDEWCYEVVHEGCEPEVRGSYGLNFSTRVVYEMDGEEVSLFGKEVRSNSFKRLFGRGSR